MARMVSDAKFFLNHSGQDRRGPNPGVQTVGHRAAFDNVVELLALGLGKLAGSSGAMAFHDPLQAILVPVADPGVDAGAMNMEKLGNIGRGATVGAEEESLQAERNARGFVSLCFLSPDQKLAARFWRRPGRR